ncbi:hypothetical protein SLA2020_233890 [Shorea laevis]
MAQNKLFSAVFIFSALILIFQEIQYVNARHLKLEKLNTYKQFLAKEAAMAVKGRSSLHATVIEVSDVDVLSPPDAPLAPDAVAGASQAPPPRHAADFRPTAPGHSPGIGHSVHN